jgi:hypothetical protein
MYGRALKETIQAGHDYRNGQEINKRIWNRTYDGPSNFLNKKDT